MNQQRTQKAQLMVEKNGYAKQTAPGVYQVKSQFTESVHYTITRTGNGLVCDCDDYKLNKADCKHLKVVLETIKINQVPDQSFRIMERSKLQLCKYCDSGKIAKHGTRKTKNGVVQRFQCQECKKRFTANFGFENNLFDDTTITGALQMYYTGMSVRDIADHYEMMGIDVSFKAVYNWVSKYSKMTSQYLNGIVPRVGTWFRADEVWIKINGKKCYLFASMDDDTRYWLASDIADTKFQHNADNLLRLTKLQAGKSPRNFITDGLPAYMKSSKKVFGKKTRHVRHIHIQRDMNNNKMERLNGEIRDREKVFRGLKKMDTAILEGMRVYYNFTKKHGGLKGKTPAQASMIEVEGKNKWRTIIQNASLNKASV